MEFIKINSKQRVIFLLSLFFSIALVQFVFINSIGYNLLSTNKKWNWNIQYLFPQGWSFFTKDSREPLTILYRVTNGKAVLLDTKNGSSNSLYGLSRENRLLLIETTQILTQIDSSYWSIINNKNAFDSFLKETKSYSIANYALNSKLHGNLLVLQQEPCPWSWRKNRDNLFMPGRGIKLNVIMK